MSVRCENWAHRWHHPSGTREITGALTQAQIVFEALSPCVFPPHSLSPLCQTAVVGGYSFIVNTLALFSRCGKNWKINKVLKAERVDPSSSA